MNAATDNVTALRAAGPMDGQQQSQVVLSARGLGKSFGGFHQAHIPFFDQVAERKPLILILLGDRNDKPQIGFRKFFQCIMVSLPDSTSHLGFLIGV